MMKTLLENIDICTDELYQCLKDEQNALANNQYETIMSLAEHKQSLVSKLEQLDQQRLQLCGNTDFALLLSQSDPELSLTWQTLTEKIQRCQHQNEVNGGILKRRNQMALEMLNIFTGRNNNDETTYGPGGTTRISGPKLTSTQV